jgi:hypothetical protein
MYKPLGIDFLCFRLSRGNCHQAHICAAYPWENRKASVVTATDFIFFFARLTLMDDFLISQGTLSRASCQ